MEGLRSYGGLDASQSQPETMALQNHGVGNNNPTPIPTGNIARAILIEPLNHGFSVTVNCQRFAIESKEALLHRLGLYLSDPSSVEREWLSGRLKW